MRIVHLQRFVVYLEEQAVVTYTNILEQLDSGKLPMWTSLLRLPQWKLPTRLMRLLKT